MMLWPRAMAPVAAKLLKTEPCPYMVITECSALPFVWLGRNVGHELHPAVNLVNYRQLGGSESSK